MPLSVQDIVPPALSQGKLSHSHWRQSRREGCLDGNFEEFGTQKTLNLHRWWKDWHSVTIVRLKRIIKDPDA